MAGYSDTYELHDLGHHAVVVTRGSHWSEESFAALRASLREDVLLIHFAGDETIEALDEVTMLEHGWVRIAQRPED